MSYSLYLYHWPVIVVLLWTTGTESNLAKIAAVVFSFALALLSYVLIEQPLRRWRQRTSKDPRLLIVGCAALIGASFILNKWLFESQNTFSLTIFNTTNFELKPAERINRNSDCKVNRVGADADELLIFAPDESCARGSAEASIFVLGDSHAKTYQVLLKKLASSLRLTARLYARANCPFVGLSQRAPGNALECQEFLARSHDDIISKAHRGDILFLPSLRLNLFADQNGAFTPEPLGMMSPQRVAYRDKSIEAAKSELADYLSHGMTVVLEAPPPIFLTPIFRCMDWFNRDNPVCNSGFEMDRQKLLAYRAPVMDALNAVRADAGKERVYIWDPFPVLCPPNPANRCSMLKSGSPLFVDPHHLSAYGSLLLLPDFKAFLDQISH